MKKNQENKKAKLGFFLSRGQVIRFVIWFVLLLSVFSVLLGFFNQKFSSELTEFEKITAQIITFILNLFGLQAVCSGVNIFLPKTDFSIVEECTGVWETIIICSAFLSYPAKFSKKLLGISLALPIIYFLNILRILVVSVIVNAYPESFEFLHLYLWQIITILIILLIWISWIKIIVKSE